jgi:hypothetical protein
MLRGGRGEVEGKEKGRERCICTQHDRFNSTNNSNRAAKLLQSNKERTAKFLLYVGMLYFTSVIPILLFVVCCLLFIVCCLFTYISCKQYFLLNFV